MATKIQLRHDTSANWVLYNPVLLIGELGYETDTLKSKLGDGVSRWIDLDYVVASGAGGGSGFSGYSADSGFSGYSGYGDSGFSGYSSTSGFSVYSGFSG